MTTSAKLKKGSFKITKDQKRKPKKTNTNSVINETNENEEDVYAVNYSIGSFRGNYRGNKQNFRGYVGFQPAKQEYRGPQTRGEVHHQIKAEVVAPLEEAKTINAAGEAKITQTKARKIANTANTVEYCWKLSAKI
jgi:hypothetical protein